MEQLKRKQGRKTTMDIFDLVDKKIESNNFWIKQNWIKKSNIAYMQVGEIGEKYLREGETE